MMRRAISVHVLSLLALVSGHGLQIPGRLLQGDMCPLGVAASDGGSLAPPDSTAAARASAIIAAWPGDLVWQDRDTVVRDSIDSALAQRLREVLHGELQPVLLWLITAPEPAPRRVTPVSAAAAHFYVTLALPSEPLQDLLLSTRASTRHKISIFRALSERDYAERRVSAPRRAYACALATQLRSDRQDRHATAESLADVLATLRLEEDGGSLAASQFLRDAILREASAWLSRNGYLKRP